MTGHNDHKLVSVTTDLKNPLSETKRRTGLALRVYTRKKATLCGASYFPKNFQKFIS